VRRLLLAVMVSGVLAPVLFLALRSRPGAKGPGAAVGQVLGGPAAAGFRRADKPHPFRFPQDHGAHPGFRNEWWYFTGNLHSADGRSFGYQLTFFRVALLPHPVIRASRWGSNEIFMAHFAVTDIGGRSFHFAERFSRAALGLSGAGGEPLTVHLEDWSAVATSARPWGMKLSAADADMAIALDLSSLTPEILNGDAGLSRKSETPGNASYYYSLPRMKTSGVIRVGQERLPVTGLSWLDREWSTSALETDQVGWDWFALQLADGRDLMFYRLRRRNGGMDPFSSGTLVFPDGSSRTVRADQVRLGVTRWWTSPASGARYPSRWRMAIPAADLDLEIVPKLSAQELTGTFRYWEGAITVRAASGAALGSGYLEMTGY
jgi:predicted secreted hydrolase